MAVLAQRAVKFPRIGMLWHAASEEDEAPFLTPFRETLAKLGYIEGQTITLEQRFPAEQYQLFESMAADLVGRKVDVLVAVTPVAAAAAKRATTTIPIVFIIHPSPVESGLVTSLARPGGNITGMSNLQTDLSSKQLELLKEAAPGLFRVAVLMNPGSGPVAQRYFAQAAEAARRLNLELLPMNVKTPSEFEPAFAALSREGAKAVVLAPDAMFFNERARINGLAVAHRQPVIALNEVMVRTGTFLYYGPNFQNLFRGAATYVDRILKGAKPADLPVQQPTRYELVINLKTAAAIGLVVPPTLVARADEVIE